MLILVPVSFLALVFMGFGVFLLLAIVLDFVASLRKYHRGEKIGLSWNSKKKDFEPETLRGKLIGYSGLASIAIGLFIFGYLTYTDLIWSLFDQYIGLVFIACVVFLAISFYLITKQKQKPDLTNEDESAENE